MALNAGNRRVCTDQSKSYAEIFDQANDFCSFLQSDEEGSDLDDEIFDDAKDTNEHVESESAAAVYDYDRKRGDEKWIGRRIIKHFDALGDFEGVVVDHKEDRRTTRTTGYRKFEIYYFEDNTIESMWPDELARHLQPVDDVVDAKLRAKYDDIHGGKEWPQNKSKGQTGLVCACALTCALTCV